MGLLRHHHDDPALRFRLQEKLMSIGDDYWIENDAGDRMFKVNGSALRLRDTWQLEDRAGRSVAKIQEKKLSVRDKIVIELDGGGSATVKKALVGIRERFEVDVEHGDDLKVHGNIVDHEYEIERDGDKIAEVSKKWFRARDTYGIDVYDPQSVVLLLAVTVAVDAMSHDVG
jgi:uncharacterized protein YxjI